MHRHEFHSQLFADVPLLLHNRGVCRATARALQPSTTRRTDAGRAGDLDRQEAKARASSVSKKYMRTRSRQSALITCVQCL